MVATLKARDPLEVQPGHTKALAFGQGGAGKTWLALSFPSPYYIDTEGGADLRHYMARLKEAGGKYLGPEDGACDFEVIREQVEALATTEHAYKTLVIDSITKVYQATIAKEAERLGDKDAFGASKKPAIAQMRRLVNWINRLDMNVWFIAHETAEWMNVGGERKEVGRMPDVWDKLPYELDLALRVEQKNGGMRTATVYKSRLEGFPFGDRFDLQRNGADVGYQEFATRYGRDFIEKEAVPIVLATPAQVAEIHDLLDIIKVSEADVEKLLARCQAERWEEVTTEQANKAIDFLTKKVTVRK